MGTGAECAHHLGDGQHQGAQALQVDLERTAGHVDHVAAQEHALWCRGKHTSTPGQLLLLQCLKTQSSHIETCMHAFKA